MRKDKIISDWQQRQFKGLYPEITQRIEDCITDIMDSCEVDRPGFIDTGRIHMVNEKADHYKVKRQLIYDILEIPLKV